ncbi:efflux RND transporter periplasmic adaptor subunit [uncultured Rikenella sp.]|uniref:efflux RND transporter periplasmic adaptor subunit n=1 Tax=uncultured Rikenella sp. TaxID=368003 RepID=UPI0026223F15|nr:efflux RND transporter periplasmic adaptor subunit [uncultured Rikenella sp.]
MNEKFSMMMKRMGLMALCCAAAVGCQQAPPAQMVAQYEVLTVEPTDRTLSSVYSASIRGRQDIDIYPQVGGTLTQVAVKEGQRVKKGQTLFVIDQVPYRAALQTATANVAAAEAQLATAQLNYDSRQELFKENVVSEFDMNTAKNTLLAAKAQLAQAKAQEVNARNSLSYTVVKSPSDGVVGTLPYRVGTLVSANMPQPLTTVSDNSDMYVYFSMTENQLLDLIREYGSKDAALKQMPEITLTLSDKSTYAQGGKIETISGVIDRATGAVSLRAVFPNKEGLLHSGGTGNVVVPVTRTGVVVIPQSATFEIQDRRFVYKVVDGKAQATPVQVTRVDGGREFIVNEGLVPGDVIVAEGVGLLREGTPIVPKGQQAAQPQQQQPQESQAQQPEALQETPAQESKAQDTQTRQADEDAAKAEAIRRHTDKE